MTDSWLVQWAWQTDPAPQLFLPEQQTNVSAYQTSFGFVVLDGVLFHQHRPDEETDAAVLARLYLESIDFLDELRGNFSFVIWDKRQGQLLVARDGIGIVPCYYARTPSLVLISPRLDDILSQPEISPDFNRCVIAEYLQRRYLSHQTNETFYKVVKRLPSAHGLRVDAMTGRLSIERYWNPIPPGFEWATTEEIERLQPTLLQAVARCLDAGADSLALSGGFDSITLAVLASQLRDSPLHAISLRFIDPECDECNEGVTQEAVAHALKMPQTMHSLTDDLEGGNPVQVSLDLSRTSPSPAINVWQATYAAMFATASKLGLRNVMMGTGGDEMFTIDFTHATDLMNQGRLVQLWRFFQTARRTSHFSAITMGREILWRYGLVEFVAGLIKPIPFLPFPRTTLPIPAWISRKDSAFIRTLTERMATNEPVPLAPGEGHYTHALRHLLQAPMFMFELDQAAAWFSKLGFTNLLPFFDRDLVDLALRVPPEYLYHTGWAKSPLRDIVDSYLKDVPIPRKKVDFTRMTHTQLRGNGAAIWERMKADSYLVDLGIILPDLLYPLIDDYMDGNNNRWSLAWTVMSTEAWLRLRIGL